ncbi:MAG: site-2 protease family protein, partial [Clostridiales bacterium]|nr:site-2 protease family protein [Clostridiales bacterium]
MTATKLLIIPGVVLGISMHEFAHAWMSDKLGDPTPRRQGRLSISPLAHIDWLGLGMLFV